MKFERFVDWCRERDLPYYDLEVQWSIGGNYCTCWGDDIKIQAQDPKELEGFPKLVNAIRPDIEMDDYRIMYDYLVKDTTDYDQDWYGGCEYFEGLEVRFKELYNYLKEKGWLPYE